MRVKGAPSFLCRASRETYILKRARNVMSRSPIFAIFPTPIALSPFCSVKVISLLKKNRKRKRKRKKIKLVRREKDKEGNEYTLTSERAVFYQGSFWSNRKTLQGLGNRGIRKKFTSVFQDACGGGVRVQSYTRNHDLRLRTFFCTGSPSSGE